MEQKPLPNEWPQHIRKDMETFLHMYPDATPDMIKRHAHAMDELTPDAEKSAQTPLPPLVSDEDLTGWAPNKRHMAHDFPTTESVRDFYEADRLKTREVVQALVDALERVRREAEDIGTIVCNCGAPATGIQLAANTALALAKSQLQIEPKP